jgi:hypothetical protein
MKIKIKEKKNDKNFAVSTMRENASNLHTFTAYLDHLSLFCSLRGCLWELVNHDVCLKVTRISQKVTKFSICLCKEKKRLESVFIISAIQTNYG